MRSQVYCSSSTAAGPKPCGPTPPATGPTHPSNRTNRRRFHVTTHAHNNLSDAHAAAVNRRQALLAGTTAAALLVTPLPDQRALSAEIQQEVAAASEGVVPAEGIQLYENTKQQYRMIVPTGWERKEKAGADVLFEDPERRSTSVGVTVSPVRVNAISQFGDLQAVGQRLLETERKKESTLNVELLTSAERQGTNGATLYDYEYELDSTRGKKRIFNTVTITGSKLYILNGNFKCDKEAGCSGATQRHH